MKVLRGIALASGFMVLALVSVSCASHAFATPTRTLTGEFVVTELSANRFRMVGHDGSFTAPAGTQMQALDGRNVQVELNASGHVMQVTELPVHIDPITHGWEIARGELLVIDAATGKFSFAGDNQTYVAPSAVDVASYAGKLVEIRLDEGGRVTDMHIVSSPQTSYFPAPTGPNCSYGDQTYSAGAAICQSGTQYRCDASQWQNLGIACQVSDARDLTMPIRPSRSCVVGDSTVANGSGICRDGTTFRCNDGAWIDSRVACR
jgi:hypothetical protein